MGDPREGVTPQGLIRTGAAVGRISERYRPAVAVAENAVAAIEPNASLYVYGSVATGQAVPPTSDIDLLTVRVLPETASQLSTDLSARFGELCRSVDIAVAQPTDLVGEHDEAYGNQVFLRHYCVHLGGPDLAPTHDFPADQQAARGFNGDIARHVHRWRSQFDHDDPSVLGRRIARKLLLAVASLVSVHDNTWTTDRSVAARRWAEVHPDLATGLARVLSWVSADSRTTRPEVGDVLDSLVDPVIDQFADRIGLWPGETK